MINMLNKYHVCFKFLLAVVIIFYSAIVTADNQQPSQASGFAFDVSSKMPSEGMLYGPLEQKSMYQVTCQIEHGNTDKEISMTICHEGKADDRNICGKDSKKITIKLSQDNPNNIFTFKNLKPIVLNKKWRESLHASSLIMLSIKESTPFKEGEDLAGNCDIKKQG